MRGSGGSNQKYLLWQLVVLSPIEIKRDHRRVTWALREIVPPCGGGGVMRKTSINRQPEADYRMARPSTQHHGTRDARL